MDELVRQEVDRLKEFISCSPAYMEYIRLREELEQKPELLEGIRSLRRTQYLLQKNEDFNSLENIAKIWQDYEKVLHHELVRHYLDSEVKICKMITKIRAEIIDLVDFGELSFVEG